MPPTPAIKGSLWSLALNLREPYDFERGWPASPLVIPEQILSFTRTSSLGLSKSPTKLRHHRFVLIVALEGEGKIAVDECIFPLQAQKLFLIFPYQFHHYLGFTSSSVRWVYITFETKNASFLKPLQNCLLDLTPELSLLLRELLELISPCQPPPVENMAQAQLLLALLFSRLLAHQSLGSSVPVDSQKRIHLLHQANQFINRNIGRNFTLKELAKEIGYSESHLRNLFRSAFSMTPSRYISDARLHKATGLLHQGILSVSKVAEACGYSSLFSFSRTFRNAMGCSPRAFRNKCEATFQEKLDS